MRNLTIFCGLVAAFLCLAQNANAQYLPAQIHRDGDGFVDEHRRGLSDSELIDAIGIDIFEDTVIGARKQYNAGRKLITGGAIAAGAGLLSWLGGMASIAAAGATQRSNGELYFEDDALAVGGALMIVSGGIAMSLGSCALSAGIPLKVIGQSRLNWVENDYNDRNYSLHVGAAPHGVGLTLNF